MIRFSTLSLAAVLAAAITAAPALAQSFNPRDGTGNVLPLQYQADGGRNAWIEARPNVQVAARKSGAVQVAARPNGSVQIAARHGKAVKIAGRRARRPHGAV
jgi:hypothetical protein